MTPKFSMLGDVAEFINGVAFKPEDWGDTGARIIRIQNLNDPTKPYNRTVRQITDKFHVYPGDILVSWPASLGVFEWEGPDVGLLNQHIFRVLPDPNKVEKRYLRHALELALMDMQRHLHGATMMHVNRGEFLATKLYLPPLPEQRRIAAILDKADALRAKRRAALAQLDELTQSIFIEMFGDPVTNSKRLPVANLEDLCKRVTDGTHQSPKWEPEGIPFLFISNIVNGEINYDTDKFISHETYNELTRRCPIQAGDVLFTTVGSYGNTAVVAGDRMFCFQRHIAHIKPNEEKLDPQFCAAMLQSSGVRRQVDKAARGVAQKTVNLADLKTLRVFAPPLEMQKKFTARLEVLKTIKGLQGQALSETDTLFTSLQHRAFRGEL